MRFWIFHFLIIYFKISGSGKQLYSKEAKTKRPPDISISHLGNEVEKMEIAGTQGAASLSCDTPGTSDHSSKKKGRRNNINGTRK